MAFITINANSQTDFFSSLENLGLETEYKVYAIHKTSDGYGLETRSYKIKFEIVKNKFDRPEGIIGKKPEDGKEMIRHSHEYTWPDHYTTPAYIRNKTSFKATFLVIDSVIYEVWEMAEDASSFKVKTIYLPQFKNSSAKDEDKKMSFKEKMAAAKSFVKGATAEMKYLSALEKMDHEKIIKDYISSMKKIQPELTSEEKKELEEIKADIVKFNEEGRKKNDAYWASEEGQATLKKWNKESGKADKWVVVNQKSTNVLVGINGMHKELKPGESWELNCINNLYYVVQDPNTYNFSRTTLIANGKDHCGGTYYLK